MLFFQLRVGGAIQIGEDITVKVVRVKGGLRLAVDAPSRIKMLRGELEPYRDHNTSTGDNGNDNSHGGPSGPTAGD